jgi:hypothetical protein
LFCSFGWFLFLVSIFGFFFELVEELLVQLGRNCHLLDLSAGPALANGDALPLAELHYCSH